MAPLPKIAADLAELRLSDLLDLQKQVAVAIVERRQMERADLKAKLTALAAEAGLSLDDVLGLRSGSKALVPPKYRNPERPEETWAGRGRKPLWLVAQLQKRGATIKDFAI